LAGVGLTVGDYVYSLPSGDTVTVQVGTASAVPEPFSMLLFGSGLGAALLRLRRRNA